MSKRRKKKKNGRLFRKLRHKYRLLIYNDNTFEEVLSYRLTRLNVFVVVGLVGIVLIFMVSLLIAFTPLKEFIPGYPDGELQKNIVLNALRVDSLEMEIHVKDQYFKNLKVIIEDGEVKSHMTSSDSNVNYGVLNFDKSKEDSMLRQKILDDMDFSLSVNEESKTTGSFNDIHFFTPMQGIVTSGFDIAKSHFGTDVVAAKDKVIMATLDGTVISSSWTLETGYVIQIQHDYNLISIYKHIDESLKEQGTKVKAGEPIAIIGNSGELSTGIHLHFELWHNGTPLNPENYVSF